MKTPINSIEMLPPVITFLSSHYEIGFSFPLAIGIFVNGESHSFLIKPREYWKQAVFDKQFTNGVPREYFEYYGLEPHLVKEIVTTLIGQNEFVFYLREDYDPRFFNMLELDQVKIRDIGLVDNFKTYEERHNEILKRIEQQQFDMYSVEHIIETVAQQTYENLKYQNMDELLTMCRDHQPRW